MDLTRRGVLQLAGVSVAGVSALAIPTESAEAAASPSLASKAATLAKFGSSKPTYWGMYASGVHSRFSTATANGRDAVCLTFDACGGSTTRYDAALIAALRKHQVSATLFINSRWAAQNTATFKQLLADPLFEIANHGTAHIPLSVTGRSAYGIAGTKDLAGVWDEVAGCHEYMGRQWGYRPRFMRSGTCFTDDVSARAAQFMGQPLVSFAINGDAGATYPAGTVTSEVSKARPGDIVISHMNHPGGGTAPGYAAAIPALKARGYKFRTLGQVLTPSKVSAPKPPVTPTKPANWVTIRYGSHGPLVQAVQRVVHVTADGSFGPGTRASVIAYQKAHHLVADGVVGPITARSMQLVS